MVTALSNENLPVLKFRLHQPAVATQMNGSIQPVTFHQSMSYKHKKHNSWPQFLLMWSFYFDMFYWQEWWKHIYLIHTDIVAITIAIWGVCMYACVSYTLFVLHFHYYCCDFYTFNNNKIDLEELARQQGLTDKKCKDHSQEVLSFIFN